MDFSGMTEYIKEGGVRVKLQQNGSATSSILTAELEDSVRKKNMTADTHVDGADTAEPSNDSMCTGYLVPADLVRAWQCNQKLLEIDRPVDKNVGDNLAELERVVKCKDDDVITPSDKQMIVAGKLGDFLTSKKTRGIDNAVVSRDGLPTSAGQTDTTQTPEERMLASIPVTYVPRTRKILQAWGEKGMTWDKDGKVYLDSRPVLGANMGSLLPARCDSTCTGFTARGIQTCISTHGISTVTTINVCQPRVEKNSWY